MVFVYIFNTTNPRFEDAYVVSGWFMKRNSMDTMQKTARAVRKKRFLVDIEFPLSGNKNAGINQISQMSCDLSNIAWEEELVKINYIKRL